LGWGSQPERIRAGIYLLFYILRASLSLLVGILFIYSALGSLCLYLLCGNSSLVGGLFYVCMIFAFLVRMPMLAITVSPEKPDIQLQGIYSIKTFMHEYINPFRHFPTIYV
jgi:hypothetical protein